MNELQLLFEWSRRIGGNPVHGNNEVHLLRQIARARGHETTSGMNEVSALRAIAASYGKSNVGYMNDLGALRAIVDGMGATPSNRNLHDMNEIDCLWAIIRAGGGASTTDADAQTYFTAVTTNGGTMSATTRAAVNAFVLAAKANGYWTKLTRINLFCGDQLDAALVPLKVGGGSATDTNNNFVAGDYSEATGLTGNGTTKYLDTGLLANALSANDTHLALYNRSSTVSQGGAFGINIAGNQLMGFFPLTDGSFYSYHYDTGGGAVAVAASTPYGFVVGSRTSATSHVLYRNAVSLASNATSGGSLPAGAIFVYARNVDGSPATYMASPIGAYSIGSGLTGANVTSYNTDMETFQDALGRGVQ